MGLYNSIATLKNNTSLIVELGSVVLAPDQMVCFWNTKNYPDSIANSIFTSLRVSGDVLTSSVISENVTVVYDGYTVQPTDFAVLFSEMITAFDKINNSGSALAQGISLNENKDPRGNMVFVSEQRVGDELIIATHNFMDKSTWYCQSVYVLNQNATDQGDGLTWKFPHENIIDLVHGKILNEDGIRESVAHGYKLRVYVDEQEVTEYSIFSPDGDGYDFFADYRNGTITFTSTKAGSVVSAHYAHADGSFWILKPGEGQIINIESAEIQFSKDAELNDALNYEVWAYDPSNYPNKVPVGLMSYKSIHNFIDDARGCYPTIPALGGALLGTTQDTIGFPFAYNTLRQLSYSDGLELRVGTKNGREIIGSRATATFYCTIASE